MQPKALISGDDVKPSLDEIENFKEAKAKFEQGGYSDDEEWEAVAENNLKQDFQVGDIIQVIKGDLTGLTGKVKEKDK